MATTYVRVKRAAEEYFSGDWDALVEQVLEFDLLLFLQISGARVRLGPIGKPVEDARDKTSFISGYFPVPASQGRRALIDSGYTQIPWVGYRPRVDVGFEVDPITKESDYAAWFWGKDGKQQLAANSDRLFLSRTELEAVLSQNSVADSRGPWPWGTYETTLLRRLAETAQRFWVNYDPSQPDTASTKLEIVNWLKARGVSERSAEQIDTILRAENLPKGPRGRK